MSLKIHNLLISYLTVLKLFLLGLSDLSASIEIKFFFGVDLPFKMQIRPKIILVSSPVFCSIDSDDASPKGQKTCIGK